MPRGTVEWFSDDEGYGLIFPDGGGEDLFVHRTGISGEGSKGLKGFDEGAKVSCEAARGCKGTHAGDPSKA
jgi:cold shock protein